MRLARMFVCDGHVGTPICAGFWGGCFHPNGFSRQDVFSTRIGVPLFLGVTHRHEVRADGICELQDSSR